MKLVAPIVLIAVILAGVASITQGGVGGVPCSNFAIAGSDLLFEFDGVEDPGEPYEINTSMEMFNTTICGTHGKAFVISVSSECTLMTDTKIKSKDMTSTFTTDQASIKVKVFAKDRKTGIETQAYPNEVTFCERMQMLEGAFQGVVTVDETTGAVVVTEEEWVRLMLNTTNANTFNFVLTGLNSTVYDIRVVADIELKEDTNHEDLEGNILAAIGDRTLIVQEVHLANNYVPYP